MGTKLLKNGLLRPALALGNLWKIPHTNYLNNRVCSSEAVNPFNYKSKYSKEQEEHIFEYLNESQPEDILKLSLSKPRLKKILTRRNNNGSFNSFSDILAIDGIGFKMMEKFCDSILYDAPNGAGLGIREKVTRNRKIKGNLLEPILSLERINSIQSVTTIFTNHNTIGWTRIEKNDYDVTHWELLNFDEGNNNKKLKLNNIIEIVSSVFDSLPKSDIYVMEAESTILRSVGADANNPRMVHVNLQKAQLVAMLSAYINAAENVNHYGTENEYSSEPNRHQFEHKVIYLKPLVPSRLFRTLIGNEKVSAQATIEKIMRCENEEEFGNVTVPDVIKDIYYNHGDIEKELLSQTMLIALAFIEVCIFKNPGALKKLVNYDD